MDLAGNELEALSQRIRRELPGQRIRAPFGPSSTS